MKAIIPRGGKSSKTYNITNLRNHLQKHPTQFKELVAKEENKKKLAEEKAQSDEGKGTTSTMKKQLKKQLSVQALKTYAYGILIVHKPKIYSTDC